jgi:hypothetical protein
VRVQEYPDPNRVHECPDRSAAVECHNLAPMKNTSHDVHDAKRHTRTAQGLGFRV